MKFEEFNKFFSENKLVVHVVEDVEHWRKIVDTAWRRQIVVNHCFVYLDEEHHIPGQAGFIDSKIAQSTVVYTISREFFNGDRADALLLKEDIDTSELL